MNVRRSADISYCKQAVIKLMTACFFVSVKQKLFGFGANVPEIWRRFGAHGL
jgi:hypothetical protein